MESEQKDPEWFSCYDGYHEWLDDFAKIQELKEYLYDRCDRGFQKNVYSSFAATLEHLIELKEKHIEMQVKFHDLFSDLYVTLNNHSSYQSETWSRKYIKDKYKR